MSTRSQVILYKDGEVFRNYYSTDGHPGSMGRALHSIAQSVLAEHGTSESRMASAMLMLECDMPVEAEEMWIFHPDIEYLWFLNITGGDTLPVKYITLSELGSDTGVDMASSDPEYEQIIKAAPADKVHEYVEGA